VSTAVLLVDDSAVSRKMLIRALPPEWKVEITQAGNGAEALEALRAGRHRVVLLDLNMPVMDGYRFLEELHTFAERPLVIVLSGDIQPLAQQRAIALGARAFVKKPANAQSIRETLHGCEVL
jgi:two-component system chemotaxis response regulator CheY